MGLRLIDIQGVWVSGRSAWWLIDHLRSVGRADDVTAASAIEHAFLNDDHVVRRLEAGEADAVLVGLLDATDGLVGLRGKLARDRRNRLI